MSLDPTLPTLVAWLQRGWQVAQRACAIAELALRVANTAIDTPAFERGRAAAERDLQVDLE